MNGLRDAAVVLPAAAAVVVTVLSCTGLLVIGDPLARVHLITPLTSLAGPLFGIALAVSLGPGPAAATVVLIFGVLALTGPAVTSELARLQPGVPAELAAELAGGSAGAVGTGGDVAPDEVGS